MSLRGVCLYAKCFHLSGDVGLDGEEGRRLHRPRSILTSATVDYKITTLGKPFKKAHQYHDWTYNSGRRDWELVSFRGEREDTGKGSFLTPTCSLGKAAFPYVLLFLLFSPSIKRQPNPLWETAMGRLLPEQTEGVTVCPGGVNKCQECLTQEGADDLCVEGGGGGCWAGGGVSLSESVPNEVLKCYKILFFSDCP